MEKDNKDEQDHPRASDDLEAAEEKSKTIDERVPDRLGSDAVPEYLAPGAPATHQPQMGIGREGPLDGGELGPGEAVLDLERRAKRQPTQRG